jgi:drug/metabolite transporter (DMT)-like permease
MKTVDNPNFIKGIFWCITAIFFAAFQPIISNSRPIEIDSFLYAIISVFYELIIIFPIMLLKSRYTRVKKAPQIDVKPQESSLNKSTPSITQSLKKNAFRLIILGCVFSIAQILYFEGFQLAGAISGAIALKSEVIFMLIFGGLFLKEHISKLRIMLTGFIFITLVWTFSQGTFNIGFINVGTIMLAFVPLLWTIGHTLTVPLLKNKIFNQYQIITIRMLLCIVILPCVYILNNPISDLLEIFNSSNILNYIGIGVAFAFAHIAWYIGITFLDLSIASAVSAPQPIFTSLLALLILGETFTIFEVIGLIVLVAIILIIAYEKNHYLNQQKSNQIGNLSPNHC